MPKNDKFDIVIIGNGLSGLLLAIGCASLIESGVKIAIIAPPITPKPDIRTTAITPHSMHLLEQWGVWNDLKNYANPISNIFITDSDSQDNFRLPTIQFAPESNNNNPYFYIIENSIFLEKLLDKLSQLSIEVIPAHFDHYEITDEASIVSLRPIENDNQNELFAIKTQLLIGADGSNSSVRQQAKIEPVYKDYNQSALTCIISHTQNHQNHAIQHFFETGPLAFLPLLTDGERHQFGSYFTSIVWTLPTHKAARFRDDSDALLNELNRIQAHLYGVIKLASPIASYPLIGHVCNTFHATRTALIGDAAHRIHPLAGQGINLGLKDIEVLISILESNHLTQNKPMNFEFSNLNFNAILSEYTKLRHRQVQKLNTSQILLNHFMSNNNTLNRIARHTAEIAFDTLSPLKKYAISLASQ